MPTPNETKVAHAEMPNETERVKAVFVKKLSSELQEYLRMEEKDSGALAAFISKTFAERLEQKFTELSPEELTELFEGIPSLRDFNTRMDRKGKSAQVFTNKTVPLEAKFQQAALEELVRAQLLARTADINYRGNGSKDKPGRNEAPHLTDWLTTYGSLLSEQNNKTDFIEGQSVINTTFPKKSETELMADAYNADPELFADMMIASGVREGATKKGGTFNEAWQRMSGKGYDNYGVALKLSEEGVPYRPGKRQEDVKLAVEKAKSFGGETKVKTYQDLAGEVGILQRNNETLGKENETLKGSQNELRDRVAELQSELETAIQREKMAKKEIAEEKEARKLAEAKAVALEKRIQELLAIAEEKIGTFTKDTRAARMKQLAESPLPSKK